MCTRSGGVHTLAFGSSGPSPPTAGAASTGNIHAAVSRVTATKICSGVAGSTTSRRTSNGWDISLLVVRDGWGGLRGRGVEARVQSYDDPVPASARRALVVVARHQI